MTAGSVDAVVADSSGGAVSAPAGTLRLVMVLGRAEAGRLCRDPLVLAGLLVSAASIWWTNRSQVPVWWQADVGIGAALLVTAGCVLVVAQLAATRACRDGMSALYESYPSSPSVRTGGLLAGLAGPALLAAVVTGLAVAWFDSQGAAGTPRPAVLAGAVLLVGLGGALGVAIGGWLRHPLASLLVVLVLGFIEVGLVRDWGLLFTGPVGWLFPWRFDNYLLSSMPGVLVPDPPGTHVYELAGLTVLLATVALLPVARRRAALALAAAAGLAVAGWSGWTQDRQVPMTAVRAIVSASTHPAAQEECLDRARVRYCYYPAFTSWVSRWSLAVDGVLALVPVRPGRPLTVRQVVDGNPIVPPLAAYNSRLNQQLNNYEQEEQANPALIPGSAAPPVYTDLSWGQGAAVASYQLNLATQVAWWVTGLPTTERDVNYPISPAGTAEALVQCLPVGQAREAIAIWLAASATPATRAAAMAGLQGLGTLGAGSPVKVGRSWVATYGGTLAPSYAGYQPRVQFTMQGGALARVMLALPTSRVEGVLAPGWGRWLSPASTDAQLAAALHLRLPPSPRVTTADLGYQRNAPADPVCR